MFEFDAVGTVPGHGFHSLKARQWSIPNLQDVHRQGCTPMTPAQFDSGSGNLALRALAEGKQHERWRRMRKRRVRTQATAGCSKLIMGRGHVVFAVRGAQRLRQRND
jgi:hypothetical protein